MPSDKQPCSRGRFGCREHERGASLVEFSIVGMIVMLVGLFTLQLGLLYHAKTTLNYATFEAARAGAVNNGQLSAIRGELGIRLAPLQGGDGSERRALIAIAKSSLKINDSLNTKITILNPTREAFMDWEVYDSATGDYFIPVNQLRHQTYDLGQHSGLSLRDANLLKLQITHGVDLRVPVVGRVLARTMMWLDTNNAAFYLRGKWPMQSVATVRMQSDILKTDAFVSSTALSNEIPDTPADCVDENVGAMTAATGLRKAVSADNLMITSAIREIIARGNVTALHYR